MKRSQSFSGSGPGSRPGSGFESGSVAVQTRLVEFSTWKRRYSGNEIQGAHFTGNLESGPGSGPASGPGSGPGSRPGSGFESGPLAVHTCLVQISTWRRRYSGNEV